MITLGKFPGVDGDPMELYCQKPRVESSDANLKMTSVVGLFVFRLGTRCVAFVTRILVLPCRMNVLSVAP